MSRLNDLREERAKLIAEARAILNLATEKAPLTAEQEGRADEMYDAADALKAKIDREERAEAAEKSLEKIDARQVEPGKPEDPEVRADRIGTDSAEYRKAFDSYLRKGALRLSADEVRALQIGTDSEGGYATDDRLLNMLIQIRDDQNVMRGLATVIQTSQDVKMPVESTLGTAAWTAEEAAYNDSDDALTEVTLSAYKLTRLVKASEELLADGVFDVAAWVVSQIGRAIGIAEEAAFVNGDGSSKPTGLVGGSGLGVTAAGVAAITSDEVIDLYHSLGRPYRVNGTFVMADATAKLIRKLKDGNSQYLWQPGLAGGQPDTILGRPVVTSDNMPAATTGLKSVVFADISRYYIADRAAPTVQRLNELYAANGQVGFVGSARVDGKLVQAAAAKHLIQA